MSNDNFVEYLRKKVKEKCSDMYMDDVILLVMAETAREICRRMNNTGLCE